MTRVGVVGTGRMGSALARALARDGHEVLLWNRTRERCDALAGQLGAGVRVAGNAAEVAANTDVTLSMVADGAAVTAIYEGPDGVLAGAHAGGVLVDMSTVPPSTIRALEPLARERGAGILDSPVSGSVGLAEAGELTLMVGGSAEDLERARPALESLAKRIVHMGPLGQWRGDEARGEHRDLRPQQRARGGARPRRDGRHRPGARVRRLRDERRRRPVRGLQAGRVRRPGRDARRRSRSSSPRRTCGSSPVWRTRSGGRCRRASPTSPSSHAASTEVGADRDFSTVAVHLRAGRAHRSPRRAEEGRDADPEPTRLTPGRAGARRGATRDGPEPHQGRDRADPGPRARRAAASRHPHRGRPDRGRRAEPAGRRRARSSTPTGDIVIPGFIDTHRHTWETSIRTCAPDYTLGAYFGAILDKFAPNYRPDDVLRRQPVGRARVRERGHHDARRLVAHHEHAGPRRRRRSRASRTPASGPCSRSASRTRRSRRGGSGPTRPAASSASTATRRAASARS